MSALNTDSKYNSLELAEKDNKSHNNQIEILDLSLKEDSTQYPSDNNSLNLDSIESIEKQIEKDTYKLDLLNNKLFNTDQSIKNPRRVANIFLFMYYKGEPLITIGPHCKFYLRNRPIKSCLIDKFNFDLYTHEFLRLQQNKR